MLDNSILIVEDEHTLRRLLEYRLRKHYAVQTAANGVEALEMVRNNIPDLIISDIMMPKMDGFALQRALQEDQHTRAIPFIFLTAKADEQSRIHGMRLGVDDYITKPFDVEQLLTRINRLLERTKLFQTQLGAKIGQDFSDKLMPKRLPEEPGYAIEFFNQPREHGGGDLFDWQKGTDGSYLFTIGDVMGKGLQAKFYAFSFLSYIRGTLHAMMRQQRSPAALMKQVNHILMQDEMMEDTFASLLLILWEPALHRLTYANAGHCPPILVSHKHREVLSYSDLILGLDPNSEFQDTTVEFPPDSAILAYTDGLLEQRMVSGELLGEERLATITHQVYGEDQPIHVLLNRILGCSDEPSFGDDILAFWLQRQAAS